MKNKVIYSITLAFTIVLLFGGFPFFIKENILNISAMGAGVTFAGKIAVVIPMDTCVNPYTQSACLNCHEGPWDDITIMPVFGGGTTVATYACKMATFIPQGGGACQIGEVIFGPSLQNQLTLNDFTATNVWCQMQ